MLVSQLFRFGTFSICKYVDMDPVLGLLVTARDAKASWDAKPTLDLFLFTFDERMIFVLLASAPLSQASASGERI